MKGFRRIGIVTVLIVFCGLILTGCGDKEVQTPANTEINDLNKTQTDTSIDTPANHSIDASEKITNEDDDTVKKSEKDALNELAFVYQGYTIAISDIVDDQKIESMLGKADEIKTHTYSHNDGLNMDQLNGMTEKQYHYPGLVIKTIDTTGDNKFFIFQIEISDSKYPTIRNSKVGDSFEKLIAAYPEGQLLGGELSDEEDDFRYEPINYSDVMNFHIKDKKVDSILFYTLLD